MKKSSIVDENQVSRRTVIASAAFIPLSAITLAPQSATAQVPATVLSAEQRRILEAFIDRLVPKDENGPGAVECGAAEYIDRCLADFLASERHIFLEGLAGVNAFALRTEGAAFAGLSAEKRDAVLTAIDNNQAPNLRGFFNRVRRLTLEGMFGDPYYGGNKNFAGWDLIKYPGPRLASSPEDQKLGAAIKPLRVSAYGGSRGH